MWARAGPLASSRQDEAVLLLTQYCQKLHIGLAPLAVSHNELASDELLQVVISIVCLKPAYFNFMLKIDVAEGM